MVETKLQRNREGQVRPDNRYRECNSGDADKAMIMMLSKRALTQDKEMAAWEVAHVDCITTVGIKMDDSMLLKPKTPTKSSIGKVSSHVTKAESEITSESQLSWGRIWSR